MQLILLESVYGLGRPGDQVSVKAGFARNFLLPQRKALRLGPDSLRMLDKLKQKAEEEERAMISSAEEMAKSIAGQAFEVTARATEEGHLFGSVTEKDIHGAITAAGWDVPLRAVRLPFHLKEAGPSEVELHLYGEIRALVTVNVVPIDLEGSPIEVGAVEAEGEGEGGEGAEAGAAEDVPETEGRTTPAAADA